MASRAIRMALRVCAAAAFLASLAPRPAHACWCVEYCDSIEGDVSAPADDGENPDPQPNEYVVTITWTPYSGAPADCEYTVEGSAPGAGEWVPQPSCTVKRDEAGRAKSAECVVTAGSGGGGGENTGENPDEEDTGGQPVGTTWTFRVTGDSASRPDADHSCDTDIFLPGPLDPPADADAERGTGEEVTISWSAPQGRQVEGARARVQSYRVYRYTQSDPRRTLVGTSTETRYVDRGLSATESYTYEIYAADQYGVGRAVLAHVPAIATAPSGSPGAGTTPGTAGASGGCSSAAPAVAPLALALLAASLLRRRRQARA